ncbi:hypothetical protein ZWY2020_001668 [Hordeum vulgare]|nr:hypothetical protein ZWY2020_001668 [Hordeum vulgare]
MESGGARRSNPPRDTQSKQYRNQEAPEGSATSGLQPKKKSFKKAAHKDKGVNVRTMPPKDFLRFRTKNHYLQEKAVIKDVEHVWATDHCRIYRDIIKNFKKSFVPVQWIDLAHLQRNPDYFGHALSLIDKLGIKEIISFKKDFDPDVVTQFYVTVHFSPDDERTMIWMNGIHKMTGSWLEFMEFLKVDFQGADNPIGSHPHAPASTDRAPAKDRLQQLYVKKGVLPKHLDIMHPIFRNTLFPRIGNFDEVHGSLVEMLLLCEEAMTKESAPLDISDVMFTELWNCIMMRKADYFVHDPIRLRIKDKWANPSTSSQHMDTDTETAADRGTAS